MCATPPAGTTAVFVIIEESSSGGVTAVKVLPLCDPPKVSLYAERLRNVPPPRACRCPLPETRAYGAMAYYGCSVPQ